MKHLFKWSMSLMILAGKVTVDAISCKDDLGQNVDWFYAYKLPKQFPVVGATQGTEFLYMKPGVTDWTLSPVTIEFGNSMIGLTLAQAYANASDRNLAVVAYNDQPPDKSGAQSYGHTKGVLVADDQSGCWVIHSVPEYPILTENPDDYSYPVTGHTYGQSFLCISVRADQVNTIGLQFVYNEPLIYSSQISDNLSSMYPNLVDAINRVKITNQPFSNLATIISSGGVPFLSFAKNRFFAQELFADWVAPELGIDLYVETWRRGTGLMPSNCSQANKVWNISQIDIQSINFTFTTTDDHSKWAVNPPSDPTPWICVGDTNRAIAETTRGGGTVCQSSSLIASSYSSLIAAFSPCTDSIDSYDSVENDSGSDDYSLEN